MTLRIAAVSFLNTIPLIECLPDLCPDSLTIRAIPSRLGPLLDRGEADVGLLPLFMALQYPPGSMIRGPGICCHGTVDSVKVFSKGDISRTTRAFVDRGSRTSVGLLRILFKEKWGCDPEFIPREPRPGFELDDGEAFLIIGDRVFECENSAIFGGGSGMRGWDLGSEWHEMTGLPFVFALWTFSPFFKQGEKGGMRREDVVRLVANARDRGLAMVDAIARRESARGKLGCGGGATPESISYYLTESLHFEIGEAEIQGIRLFFQLCIEHGLLPLSEFPGFFRS